MKSILSDIYNKVDSPNFIDIVFENKNKAYGAYVLRKLYDKYLAFSFIIALSFILILFMIPWLLMGKESEPQITAKAKKKIVTVSYTELASPPPIQTATAAPEAKGQLPREPKAGVKFLPPVVKPDVEVVEEEIIPTQEELRYADTRPLAITVEGAEVEIIVPEEIFIEEVDTVEEVVIIEESEVYVPEEEPVLTIAAEMPVFPGGQAALNRFLTENIQYPEKALESNVQGIVFVQFVIEKDGHVNNIQVLKGIGWGCDEEAVRVVKLLPNWKPGIQNNMPVRVKYVLPVKFRLTIKSE